MKAFIALMLLAFATPAFAQAGDSTSQSSTSGAQAANNVTVVADAGRYAPADSSVRYSGHTWTTPSVGVGYIAGANGCLVGKSAAAAGGPIALSFSSGSNDNGCDIRQDVGVWYGLGRPDVAIARMCQRKESADAFFAATHYACPGQGGERYKYADGTIAPEMIINVTPSFTKGATSGAIREPQSPENIAGPNTGNPVGTAPTPATK